VDDLRAALAAFVGLGVAWFDTARPSGVAVLNPTIALGRLIENLEDSLLRQYRAVADTWSELATVSPHLGRRPEGAHPDLDGVERVESPEQMRERLEELSFAARGSVFCIQPGGPHSRESLAAARMLDLRGLRHGVDKRSSVR